MYTAIRTARLYEQIVEQIERSIKQGVLKPGDQLPAERELAQQFGVSRTAVREAMKTLGEKGLVGAYSGRGTFITVSKTKNARQALDVFLKRDDPESLKYVAEVREMLEMEISAMAATKIEEQHLVMMRDAIAAMDREREVPEAYIEADLDFHLSLAEAVGNPLILALLDSIVGVLREQRMGIFNVPGGPERGQIHHKRILDAIERRDPAKAREAMREHLQQVRDDYRAAEPAGKP